MQFESDVSDEEFDPDTYRPSVNIDRFLPSILIDTMEDETLRAVTSIISPAENLVMSSLLPYSDDVEISSSDLDIFSDIHLDGSYLLDEVVNSVGSIFKFDTSSSNLIHFSEDTDDVVLRSGMNISNVPVVTLDLSNTTVNQDNDIQNSTEEVNLSTSPSNMIKFNSYNTSDDLDSQLKQLEVGMDQFNSL